MGMAAPIYFTGDMVRTMPDDGNRYEVVRGELLVTPSPRPWHQIVLKRLYDALNAYLEREPVGILLWSPADISWGDDDVLVQPDLFVVPREELRPLDWTRLRTLLLVVEVLSPASIRGDRFTKRVEYQRREVPLYWIVDGDEHVAEVWTPEAGLPVIERERLVWHPAGASTQFTLDLSELFRPL